MSNLNVFKNEFYFISDNGDKKLIFNFNDFLSNKSHVPLHFVGEKNCDIIPELVLKIIDVCNLPENDIKPVDKSMLILTAIMVIKKYMYRPKGNSILEIGCTSGILSYFLGLIINFFGKSSLQCVSDVISSDGKSDWLNCIMLLDDTDDISIAYSNFNDINFRDSFYDITIINGYDYFEDHEAVIRNAIRMTKKNGLLLCIGKEQPLLCDSFKVLVDDFDTYEFDSNNIIFTKLLDDKDKLKVLKTENEKIEILKKDFNDLESKILSIETLDEQNLDNIILIVDKLQKSLLEVYNDLDNIDIKFEMSEFKETLINYRLRRSNSEQNLDTYIDKCKEKYFAISLT